MTSFYLRRRLSASEMTSTQLCRVHTGGELKRCDRHVVGKSTEHQPLVLHFNRRLRSQFPVWLQHRRSQPTEAGLKRNSIFLVYFCYFVTHSAL